MFFFSQPPPKQKKVKKEGEEGEAEEEPAEEAAGEEEGKEIGTMQNLVAELRTFERTGTHVLTEEEIYRLMVTIKKQLLEKKPLSQVRFFGKIFALKNPYYVVEGSYRTEEDRQAAMQPASATTDAEGGENAAAAAGGEDGGEGGAEGGAEAGKQGSLAEDPDFPGSGAAEAQKKKKKESEIPAEKNMGTNQYCYWVCTVAGGEWIALPDVTPEQIQAARKIKRYFTGDLSASVPSHPAFPGTEKEYLRAQIARIAHSTAIAPRGHFKLAEEEPEEEEEEEEEGGEKKPKKEKPIYRLPYMEKVPEIVPRIAAGEEPSEEDEEAAKKLELPKSGDEFMNLKNWVHVLPSILQTQGRCLFFKPEKPEGEEGGAEEEEMDEEAKKLAEAKEAELMEKILPILAPLNLAHGLGKISANSLAYPAWRINKCQERLDAALDSSLISAKSLRWPGAVSYVRVSKKSGAVEKFGSIYVGNGHKYDLHLCSTPQFAPASQNEFAAQEQEQVDPEPEKYMSYREPPKPVQEPQPGAEGDAAAAAEGGEAESGEKQEGEAVEGENQE